MGAGFGFVCVCIDILFLTAFGVSALILRRRAVDGGWIWIG